MPSKKKPLLNLSILWLSAVLLAWPFGDFPLNDDWAYGQSVRLWIEQGQFQLPNWQAMTLLAQLAWGGLWAKIFGFSYTVLRFSTLSLGWLGLWACYRSFLLVFQNAATAMLATLVILFNPWFFSLSFTFMTDVPFLALFMLSTYFFLLALKNDRYAPIAWATLFSMLAVLIRQFGLLPPLAFGIAYHWKKPGAGALLPSLLPFAFTLGTMTIAIEWMEYTQGLAADFGRLSQLGERLRASSLPMAIYERGGILLFYWGLFLLPMSWAFLPNRKDRSKWTWISLSAAILIVIALAFPAWKELPAGNMLYNFGLGPKVLKDGYFGENVYPKLSPAAWGIIKIAGFAGAVLLVWSAIRRIFSIPQGISLLFWIATATTLLLYCGYLMIDYFFWDRYFLLLLPFWLTFLIPEGTALPSLRVLAPSLLILILTAAFTVAATHDYLSWNRARWKALHELTTRRNIPPSQIDGGFEFNGLHQPGPRRPILKEGKSWWFVEDDRYVVAFGPLECYAVEKTYFFRRWLPPGKDSLCLLRQTVLSQNDTLSCDAEQQTTDGLAFLSNKGMPQFENGDRLDTTHTHSGRQALLLNQQHPFGLTVRLSPVQPCERFLVTIWKYGEEANAGIVISANDANRFYSFETKNIIQSDSTGWGLLQHEVQLPVIFTDTTLLIYFWNAGGRPVWIDDMKIIR